MYKRSQWRGIAIAFFVLVLSFWNYSRLSGSECIRAIHIMTLLTCGAAIGVIVVQLFMMLRNR